MSKNQNNNIPYTVSQNFLTCRKTIDRLIRIARLQNSDTVLEIGAGKGHITNALSDKCKKIISYEIDKHLYDRLKYQISSNVCLRHGDFLKCRLPHEQYKVFANIPFSITTSIINKLTTANPLPQGMWLIMEKGAAKRFCGKPKESLNSLLIKPKYDTRIVYHFRREDFHPAPSVDVVMLEFRKKEKDDVSSVQWNDYCMFIQHSMKYGIFGKNALLTKKQIDTALRLEGLPKIVPSDEILYIQWLCLFRCWLRWGKRTKKY